MDFIPQSANSTPFRAPIFTIAHFVTFGVNPEKIEKLLSSSTRYAMDFESFRKNVESSK